MSKLRPIVISGPSGAGKSTILKKLFTNHPSRFGFSVSNTTRQPRPGERDGIDYNFLTTAQFEDEIKEGKFIEYAKFSGNYYGTTIEGVKKVRDAGKTCILDIDSQGVKLVKKTDLDARYLFIAPPSMEELERRLRARQTDSEGAITTRLETARLEMEVAKEEGMHDKVIVNDDLERAYVEVERFCL